MGEVVSRSRRKGAEDNACLLTILFEKTGKIREQLSFPTEQVPVSAYGGSLKNLKDLCEEPEGPKGASLRSCVPP